MSSLTSNFKPFVFLSKLFGLPLDKDWSICGLRYSKWILPIYCSLSLIVDLLINGVMARSVLEKKWKNILLGFNESHGYEENYARAELAILTNSLSRYFLLAILPAIFSIHVYLTGNWNTLWLNLLKIQEDMKLSANFMKKFKWRCYSALVLLALVSESSFIYQSIIP